MSETFTVKQQLREKIQAVLKKTSSEERQVWSGQIVKRLQELSLEENAGIVTAFYPLSFEVDIKAFLRWLPKTHPTQKLALPYLNPKTKIMEFREVDDIDTLTLNSFEIAEPDTSCARVPFQDIKTMLIPGLAFDRSGNRLGRGQAYFDQTLALMPKNVRKIGICFEVQVLEHVLTEKHDVAMNEVITEKGCYS